MFFDKNAVIQVLGGLLKDPSLLIEEEYSNLQVEDFPEKLHRIIYASIYNLIHQGMGTITPVDIDEHLKQYNKNYELFQQEDGFDYLVKCMSYASLENFDYSVQRIKKFSLLNQLRKNGFDTSDIYNPNILDAKEQEEMQNAFNNMTLEDILDAKDKKLVNIRDKFTVNLGQQSQKAGKGLRKLKEDLKETPEMGAPLGSGILTTIARGARKTKFYLRSAESGMGKTRMAVEDAATISIRYYYDWEAQEWMDRQYEKPTLFITTELEIDEIQTMFLAHISGVNEDTILNGQYTQQEEEIVDQAVSIIENSPIYIERIPSFNMTDIERAVKKHKLNHHISYIFFDYIFTSPKMLMEIAQQTKGMRLREDNVLYLFANRMKELCNQLNIFFYSATQVNGDIKHVHTADEAVLRGSKAMADKIDLGVITKSVSPEDLEHLKDLIGFGNQPNVVYHIYKVRRGRFSKVKLWCRMDLGTCRTKDLFLTDNNYNILDIESTAVEQILDDTAYTFEEMQALDVPPEEPKVENESEGGEFHW